MSLFIITFTVGNVKSNSCIFSHSVIEYLKTIIPEARTVEIRILRSFLEAAREGNMTRAAERLYLSQPTVSKQIRELEEELGAKLFIRSNYSVRLTEAGMLLKERAEDILSLVDRTEAEFKSL